jgi:hypothetical protein
LCRYKEGGVIGGFGLVVGGYRGPGSASRRQGDSAVAVTVGSHSLPGGVRLVAMVDHTGCH